ncbi:MAG TPA: YhdP family protein, partial [Burkholderiales bacterium]|nr:YhdP family protein [Burkholderiales bacterium]
PRRYRARARFAELGLKPWRAVPGFSGLDGSVEASETGGRVYLQSRDAAIDVPSVFPEPRLAFDTLSGQIDWQLEPGRFSARLTSVSFANKDLSGSVFGAYTRGESGPGAIDLSGTLTRADARRVSRYLPLASIMGEKPRAWLVAGIVDGQASDVHLRLRGNLADFPYADAARGQFLVTAHVQNGTLDYADGWPRIEAIDADLQFERTRMDIVGRSGTILGARLAKVRVSIPDLGSHEPQLSVAGEASGPTEEFLKFIAASPVRRMTAGFTDAMAATGSGRLQLSLALPLARLEASRVAGDYEFAANGVRLHPRLAPLERASGRLSFTEASFTAHEVRGRLLGGPVAISGGTRGKGALEFSARGELSAQSFAALPESWRRLVSGHASYSASLALRDGASRLVVESSLRGLASALPAPLAKSAAAPLPLRVEVQTTEGGARERILAGLGKLVAAEALREARGGALQFQRAGVRLTPRSGEVVRLPEKGVSVQGSLAELDLDGWRSLAASGAPADPPGGVLLDVKLARLRAFGQRFSEVAVRASGSAQSWSAAVSAAEAEGQLGYHAQDGGRLVARLARFDAAPELAASGTGPLDPGELPAVDFIAERFALRGKSLGRVELAAHPEGGDWRIDKLAIANADATLSASARWRGGAAHETALDFSLQARDTGRLLDRLGYAGVVAGGKAQLDGSVSWQGEPFAFDGATLSGDMRLSAEDGQFLEIEPGIGKLISLMSLQALPRRITLDFRDVFSKGFRFDRVEAASHAERGLMQLREFRMRGPAAEVEMSGEVNLAAETQDLHVRVVPGLGGSASTAIAIVNPVAGVTAALAQRVLKDPLGQIFAHDFSVTGGWSEPQVTRLEPPPAPVSNSTP